MRIVEGFGRAFRCGIAVMAFGWTGLAVAQEGLVLEEVVVESSGVRDGSTGPVDGYVAKETTTGSKSDTPVREVPQSVSVVGREEIDDRGAQKVDEALRYTAGVFTQPFGPDADTNWIYVRGFDATQSGVYQDGLQLFGEAFGSFFIDSYSLERIEVLKGPASVLYGGSNPGGIVNYVSKRPTGETRNRVEAGIDTFGVGYVGLDADGVASETVDYRFVGRIYGGEGFYDNEEQFRGVASPSITWSPDETTKLTVLANYTYMDNTHGVGSFLPYVGTVKRAPFGRIDPEFNPTEPDLDDYERQQASIGYEFEHTFDSEWTVRQNTRFSRADLQEQLLYGNGLTPDELLLNRINFAHDTRASTVLLDNQLEGTIITGPVEHRLLAGFDYKYYNIDQVQASALFGTTTPINPDDPDYGGPETEPVSYLNRELSQNQLGAYVQDQLRFGDGWIVTLNGRYDGVWIKSHDGPTFYSPDQDIDRDTRNGELSGRAGLAYEFANGVIPYASVASFFNPLIGTTGDGEFFVPETGQQYEAGVKYAPDWFDGIITAAVFDITRQNVLTVDPSNIFAQVQTGEVRSRGFEFEAKADVNANLQVTASVTLLDLEIKETNEVGAEGNRPFLIPEEQASLFADYTFHNGRLDGLSVGGGVRYVGSSFADTQNELKVPFATLVDAKIGYKKDNWEVGLVVTNLFDNEYVAGCQGANVCSYGESRRALLNGRITW